MDLAKREGRELAGNGDSISLDTPSATDISEDDRLRSDCMRRIIGEVDALTCPNATPVLPRVLVQFWNDAKSIPPDVSKCLDTWRSLDELGFERLLFDDHSASQFIGDCVGSCHLEAFERCKHPAMRADYFRLCFLMVNGGFYVDADDVYQGGNCQSWFCDNKLKLHPLCYSISTDSMVKTADFLTKIADSPDLIYYVNNNPIIAPPGHPVICLALERSTQILLSQAGCSQNIQSITGPGNLTASLVRHDTESKRAGKARDFALLSDWDTVSVSCWPLQYRKDERNWRLWRGGDL